MARAHHDFVRTVFERHQKETDQDLRRLTGENLLRAQGRAIYLEELLAAMKSAAEGNRK